MELCGTPWWEWRVKHVEGDCVVCMQVWVKLIILTALITRTPNHQMINLFGSCRSLVDTIYSLKDEVQELKQVSAPIDEHRQPIEMFPSNSPAWNAWSLLLTLSPSPLFKDNKRMRRTLEEEQRARKELERIIRRVLKSMNDPSWDETNLWDQNWSSGSQPRLFPDV